MTIGQKPEYYEEYADFLDKHPNLPLKADID